jgi:RNA polymerase-binding transcription factor DksA
MRRFQTLQHLSDEFLDDARFNLTAVLARLTTGHSNGQVHAAERAAEPPVWESTAELAQFCKRHLAANRSNWTSFLARQVSEALERIDNGSYGLCLQFGQPIGARRLAALPWVELCITCQEEST